MSDLSITKPEKGHYGALDGWRGICACMVAMFHFRAFSHITESDFVKSGGSLLDFFFVLSGFVIFANYYQKLKDGYSLKDFMLLRFGRLYPLHFSILLIFILGDLLQLVFPFIGKGAVYPPFEGPGESIDYVLANLFLLHSFGVTEFISLNAPSWSISAEFYTYLIYGSVLLFTAGRKGAVAGVIGLVLAVLLYKPVLMSGTANFGILRCIYGFGCGGLIWLLFNRIGGRMGTGKTAYFHFVEIALFIAVFIYLNILLHYAQTHEYLLLLSPVMYSLTVFVFAFEKGVVSKILTGKIFVTLGALSYSIYMIHVLISGKIFYGVGHIVEKVSGIKLFTIVNGIDLIGVNKWMGDAICAVYMASVIIASYITYRLIEVPGRDYFRRRVKARQKVK